VKGLNGTFVLPAAPGRVVGQFSHRIVSCQ
jgi:hypothetical protein